MPAFRALIRKILGLVSIVSVPFFFLPLLNGFRSGASLPHATWIGAHRLLGTLFVFLPGITCIAFSMLPTRFRTTRLAVAVAAATTVCMLLLRALAIPLASGVVLDLPLHEWSNHVSHDVLARDSSGMWSGLLRLIDDPSSAQQMLSAYPPGHLRPMGLQAIQDWLSLLVPWIVGGLVIGIFKWMEGAVTFRTPRDEWLASTALVWVLVPFTQVLIVQWVESRVFEALFRGAPFWSIVLPYIPFLVMCACGWYSAVRIDRARNTGGIPLRWDGRGA